MSERRFEEFVGLIAALDKEVGAIKSEAMATLGLKGPDSMVLYHLQGEGRGLTSAELARRIGVDRAATSRTVRHLEAAGLVEEAEPTAVARHRRLLRLTARGRAVTQEVDRIIGDVVERAGAGIGEDERAAMYGSLRTVLANLQELRASRPGSGEGEDASHS